MNWGVSMALRFAANIHFLYLEYDFLDRFKAAADDGFEGIEMTFPYDVTAEKTARAAAAAGLPIVEFNTPAGDLIPGKHRGHAPNPGEGDIFLKHIQKGARYARDVGCRKVLTLSGLKRPNIAFADQRACYIDNLKRGAELCASYDTKLLIEPNNVVDFPGYFLETMADVRAYIAAVDHPNLGAVFDFFHSQINEGDVTRCFSDSLDLIDHVQFGDNPGRHEPGTGELNFDHLFNVVENSGYTGWVGAEYFPSGASTHASLDWLRRRQ
ncbi:TIM barrel protein [Roseobacter sp. YSTF-M11]|uniref:TIM barrel protein n=1 Tax=Roseobacter insulae TaxID=2859783 RepID=A0A9X1FS43_9RHOB|nr:TIM barrel protein [Roseobacter insulae]MBW4706369.1 TIM barrel protein [Roseobacter insulae]